MPESEEEPLVKGFETIPLRFVKLFENLGKTYRQHPVSTVIFSSFAIIALICFILYGLTKLFVSYKEAKEAVVVKGEVTKSQTTSTHDVEQSTSSATPISKSQDPKTRTDASPPEKGKAVSTGERQQGSPPPSKIKDSSAASPYDQKPTPTVTQPAPAVPPKQEQKFPVEESIPPSGSTSTTVNNSKEKGLLQQTSQPGGMVTVSDQVCPSYTPFNPGEIAHLLGPLPVRVAVTAGSWHLAGEGSGLEVLAYGRYRICNTEECDAPQPLCENTIEKTPICSFARANSADDNRQHALKLVAVTIKKTINSKEYSTNQSYIGEMPCPKRS